MTTSKEIFENLDGLLLNPKSKNFINHLVRAYFPITNVEKVWDKSNGEMKCVITKATLNSVQDILEDVNNEENKFKFYDYLKTIFDQEVIENPLFELMKNRELGLRGLNTTTFMSLSGFRIFTEWVLAKSLAGDKHINWLLGSIKRGPKPKNPAPKDVIKKEEEPFKKSTRGNAATYTLGETAAFKKLFDKFNDEN